MSPDGVHDYEMPKCPDDQWPADDPLLAAFAEDLRIVADGPAPEPRPGLVAVMRQGAVPIEPSTPGRKNKMLVKTLLGGLAAKVAMGVGLATASVTAAGAAGVLPEPAQNAVASVVGAVTGLNLPDPSGVTTLVTGDESGGSTTTTTTVSSTTTTLADPDDDGSGGDTTRAVNHGACVSAAAKDKSGEGPHGRTVSSVARSDCGKTDGSTTTTVPGSTTTTTVGSTTTTTAADGLRSSNSGPGNSGNSGNSGRGNSGNGGNGGNGNGGNSGPGNSGRN